MNKIKYILKIGIIAVIFQGMTYCSALDQTLQKHFKTAVDAIKSEKTAITQYYDNVIQAIENNEIFVDYTNLPDIRKAGWFGFLDFRTKKTKTCNIFDDYFSPFLHFNLKDFQAPDLMDKFQKFLAHILALAQDKNCWMSQIRYVEDMVKSTRASLFGKISRFGRQAMIESEKEIIMAKAKFLLKALADSAIRSYDYLSEQTKDIQAARTIFQKLTFRGVPPAIDYYILAVFNAYKNIFPEAYIKFRSEMLRHLKTYIIDLETRRLIAEKAGELTQKEESIIRINAARIYNQIYLKTEPSHLARNWKYYAAGTVAVAGLGYYLYKNKAELSEAYKAGGIREVGGYVGRQIKGIPATISTGAASAYKTGVEYGRGFREKAGARFGELKTKEGPKEPIVEGPIEGPKEPIVEGPEQPQVPAPGMRFARGIFKNGVFEEKTQEQIAALNRAAFLGEIKQPEFFTIEKPIRPSVQPTRFSEFPRYTEK